MVTSPEYPDLPWIPARSFTRGRVHGQPTKIVIHKTDNVAPARGEANYAQRRADGTSAHYFVDGLEVIQGVRTTDTAHTALYHGNADGIQYELCGRSGEPTPEPVLRLAARQIARDMKRYGIPLRRLVGREVRYREARGICGHVDMTIGWPEDGGSHTDPGKSFEWSTLLSLISGHMEGDEEMALEQEVQALQAAVASLWTLLDKGTRGTNETSTQGGVSRPNSWLVRTLGEIKAAASAPAPVPVVTDEQLRVLAVLVTEELGHLRFVPSVEGPTS